MSPAALVLAALAGFVLGCALCLTTGAQLRKRPRQMPQDARGAPGNPSGNPPRGAADVETLTLAVVDLEELPPPNAGVAVKLHGRVRAVVQLDGTVVLPTPGTPRLYLAGIERLPGGAASW